MKTDCRCYGSGTYTAEISIANAVVCIRRVCIDHLARRTRVRDTSTGRIGEFMDVATDRTRVYLRPVNGGREWTADVGALEPATDTP